MTETPVLALPLVQPAQAQKHVTVNEALSKLDGLACLTLASATTALPPEGVPDGVVYAVPPGAVNAWAGQAGRLALAQNGGWVFTTPTVGWRAMVRDQGAPAIWDGANWRLGAQSLTQTGAGVSIRSVDFDVALTSGSSVTTQIAFPARAIAFGVTGHVIEAIPGPATGWEIGVSDDLQRYGSGLGVAQNTWVSGPSAPVVYWVPTALEITALGGDFGGGTLRLAAHYAELTLPDAV